MGSLIRPLLVQGNDKLSQAIHHWDLPAGLSCPGASALCREHCYALKGRYVFPQVQERLHWCYDMSKRNNFVRLMIDEIRRKGLEHTPTAVLSRGTTAVRCKTLIVNLPGSPKGAVESLEVVAHLLPHAVKVLHGARHD